MDANWPKGVFFQSGILLSCLLIYIKQRWFFKVQTALICRISPLYIFSYRYIYCNVFNCSSNRFNLFCEESGLKWSTMSISFWFFFSFLKIWTQRKICNLKNWLKSHFVDILRQPFYSTGIDCFRKQ